MSTTEESIDANCDSTAQAEEIAKLQRRVENLEKEMRRKTTENSRLARVLIRLEHRLQSISLLENGVPEESQSLERKPKKFRRKEAPTLELPPKSKESTFDATRMLTELRVS